MNAVARLEGFGFQITVACCGASFRSLNRLTASAISSSWVHLLPLGINERSSSKRSLILFLRFCSLFRVISRFLDCFSSLLLRFSSFVLETRGEESSLLLVEGRTISKNSELPV